MERFGYITIKLNELLEKKLSKNKLSHRAEMEWSQIAGYCDNTITCLDAYILENFCTVLNCEISDLLEFVPEDKEKELLQEAQNKAEKRRADSRFSTSFLSLLVGKSIRFLAYLFIFLPKCGILLPYAVPYRLPGSIFASLF